MFVFLDTREFVDLGDAGFSVRSGYSMRLFRVIDFFFGGQRSEIALCRLLEISGSKETKTAENTSASWKDNKSNTAFKVNPSSLEGTLNLYVS